MLTKQQLTQALLPAVKPTPKDLDDAVRLVWQTGNDPGWRLTTVGYDALCALEFEHHFFAVERHMPVIPRHLLVLDRKLTQPYYIHIGKKVGLTLFGSKEAVMYAMYGDFKKFIDYLDRI
jgi:hypothetical protein